MKKYLILYSTVDGHTKKICDKICEIIKRKFYVETLPIEFAEKKQLESFDYIIVGASIRYVKHRENVSTFVKDNIITLDSKMTAFFSVNVVARKPEKSKPEQNPYVIKFLNLSKWKPNYVEVFAGKIDYPSLRLIDRYMIKIIMWLTKGPTNTRFTYDFTDWKKVECFARVLSA